MLQYQYSDPLDLQQEVHMEKNGTVMDYLRWRGDLPFCRDGFNEVDNLVLCIISYINFRRFDDLKTTDPAKAVALPEVAARLTEEDEQRGLSELAYIPLMRLAAETERFRDVRMFGFTHEWDEAKEMQFDAVSYPYSGKPAKETAAGRLQQRWPRFLPRYGGLRGVPPGGG